jgi:hypothetical protein
MKKIFAVILFIFSLLHLQAQNCPVSILVEGPAEEVIAGGTFGVTATVKSVPADVTITYNWSISSGTITSGQGTPYITIDAGTGAGSCTATIDIGGLPKECSTTASATVFIKAAPEKIITTNTVTKAGIKEAVNTFVGKTDFKSANSILDKGLINVYSMNKQQFAKIKIMIDEAFQQNGIFPFQYDIIDKGIQDVALVELFYSKK